MIRVVLCCLLVLPSALIAQTKKKVVIKSNAVKTKTASAGDPTQQSTERGKAIYKLYCLACHQPDGGGVGTLNPPYTKEWTGGDKSRIIKMILKGSSGKVEIDGDKFSNTMPAQPYLTDQQLADVLTYVRKNFVNASPVSAAEIKAVRAKLK
jgi:Cytochrome c, mono- and diheme variants